MTTEIENVAFDEAWGALKGYHQRLGYEWTRDEAAQDRTSLRDAVNNGYVDGIDAGDLAEKALHRMGYTTKRDIYSLEIVA